jgi:hypothetical protein
MKDKNKYIPYGIEWENEMMKLPKKFLVDFLKKTFKQNVKLEDENFDLKQVFINDKNAN